ncbi:MAG TPA: hypothetical protein VHJ78_12895 [Actinomycetota bacterium]|nr:hypothetical protein [Actinomycetota bacterium]
MLGAIFGSVLGKVLAAVLGVAGLAGGLAAAGALPGAGSAAPEVQATVDTPAGNVSLPSGATGGLDLNSLPAGSAAAEAVGLINDARSAAALATTAAQQCLDNADSQLSTLMTTLRNVTSLAQAQGLLGQAQTIGANAQKCADEARALGKTSVDRANAASAKAALLEGLPGLGGLSGLDNPEDLLAQILAAAEDAGAAAAAAETLAIGIVNKVITTVGSMLPLPGGEGGGLPLPIPGTGEGGLPLPGTGEGGLPIPELPGLPLPGTGEGGLPLPGTGEGGLPVPGLDGLGGAATGIVDQLAGSILGGLGGGLPVPL